MEIYRHNHSLHKLDGNKYEYHRIAGTGRVVHRFTRDVSEEEIKTLREGFAKLGAKKLDDVSDKGIEAEVLLHQKTLTEKIGKTS